MRTLKPDGILIAIMLNKFCPYEIYDHYVHRKIISGARRLGRIFGGGGAEQGAPRRPRPLTLMQGERAFKGMLTSGGLRIEDALTYDFHIVPPPLDSLLPRTSLFLSDRLESLGLSPLRLLGRGILVKCRKGASDSAACSSTV